jgi:hypothetical protein
VEEKHGNPDPATKRASEIKLEEIKQRARKNRTETTFVYVIRRCNFRSSGTA